MTLVYLGEDEPGLQHVGPAQLDHGLPLGPVLLVQLEPARPREQYIINRAQ